MQSFSLYLINVFTASIFIMLWRVKPESRYFLHWGVALLAIPVVQATTAFLFESPSRYYGFATLTFVVFITLMIGGAIIGGCYFRYQGIARSKAIALTLALAAFTLVLLFFLPFEVVAMVMGGLSMLAFLAVAFCVWGENSIARTIASMFGLKAVMVVFFAVGSRSAPLVEMFYYLAPLAASIYLLQAIYLLTQIFKSINDELRVNLVFKGLVSAVSESAQNAPTEQALASSVLAHLMESGLWDGGMSYKVDRASRKMIRTGHVGAGVKIPEAIDLAGTLTEQVLRRKEPLITSSAAITASVSPEVQKTHRSQKTNDSVITLIPLIDRDQTEGVIILFHAKPREIIGQELDALNSIGHVVGLAQAKLHDREILAARALYDSLTGLGNRALFHDYYKGLPAASESAVMLFDLNDFKGINDVFGHAVGDQFLVNLSKRLMQGLPDEASAFRLGGDEFVVVYHATDNGLDVIAEAEFLSRLIKEPVVIEDFALRSSAAIGVVSSITSQESHELLRSADLAMYEAKRSDLPIMYYEESMAQVSIDRMNWLVEIERAMVQGELEMFYQPVMSLKDKKIVKYEALVRWHHPENGLIEAVDFMPLIESSPIIDALTLAIINMVAADIAQFRQEGKDVAVSVNLSARNMIDTRLPEMIDDILKQHALPSELLHLEITETGLMRDLTAAQAVAKELVARGYSLVIDDFGAGQSSLAYLSRFAVKEVKIDKAFVLQMAADEESLRLVRAIIELVHKLGFKATAEGVENAQTRDELAAIGCDFAQGYHYARPMAKADLVAWLDNTQV